jgi:hypothetical protein
VTLHAASPGLHETQPSGLRSRAAVIALVTTLALAIAVRVYIALRVYHYFIDDAYIFMRYARNFATGRGLDFNPGEAVLGFTSPLFTLALALLARGFRSVDPGLLIAVFNSLLLAGFAVVVARLFLTDRPRSWVLPLVLGFYFPFVDASLNGMETTLMLLTMTGALLCLVRGRNGGAVVVAALSALTRPEGVIFFTLVVLYLLVERRSAFPWKSFALAAGLGLAWVILGLALYGTAVPQSMVAKSALFWHGAPPPRSTPFEMHLYLSLGLTDGVYHALPAVIRAALLACGALVGVFFAWGLVHVLRTRSPLLVLALFYVLALVLYTVGNPVDLSSWHTIPTALASFATAFVGVEALLSRWRTRAWDAVVLAGVALASGLSIWIELPPRARSINDVQESMVRLADHVRREIPGATSIATHHIGLLGYRSDLRIVDLGALVMPAVMRDEYLSDTIQRERPGVLVLQPTILEDGKDRVYPRPFRTPAERAAFIQDYVSRSVPGLPHLFVSRGLLAPGSGGGR